MSIIIDRRQVDKNKSSENRKKFIQRNKRALKQSIDEQIKNRSMKDKSGGKVKVRRDTIEEPTFRPDRDTGWDDFVAPGNRKWKVGDKIPRPSGGQGRGSGPGNGGSGEDDFEFTLTRDEFLDLFFEGMALPNFIKKSLKKSFSVSRQRAGYTKDGIPAQMSIKKTFENAIARRIASKAEDPNKKPAYLDDIDLRYKNFINVPKPDKKAVMFCILDVSGSMGEREKLIAKKFFILLHLFLEKTYREVDLIFIKHHTEAKEVDEEDFFYSRETGGTIVSSALNLVADIVKNRYDVTSTNFYIAQASDGDNWDADNQECINVLEDKILPNVQYMAYINIIEQGRPPHARDLRHVYGPLEDRYGNIKSTYVLDQLNVYRALYDLFKKGGAV
jgi:uncharacterized sporulation protein YeaH/YhbH (DUF444 family)